jgi:hypothetical protein
MVGIIWTVQLVIYPLFGTIRLEAFAHYHHQYMRRITWVVLPLMTIEAGSAAWLWFDGLRSGKFLWASGLLVVIWASTGMWQVPLHHRLNKMFRPELHRRLVRTNWIRTLAWTLRAGLLLGINP